MTDYDNEKRGVLFKNDDKREGRKDPDYTGKCEVDGVEYWLSAWIQEAKSDGRKFMSLRFNPKDDGKKREVLNKMPAATTKPDFDDQIPF